MARQGANRQKAYLAKGLLAAGLATLLSDLFLIGQPLVTLVATLKHGLGVLPALGMCVLNATQAIAFHQVGYFSLISQILVLFTAMVTLIAGLALLRPNSARPRIQTFELLLSNEVEKREISNGSR